MSDAKTVLIKSAPDLVATPFEGDFLIRTGGDCIGVVRPRGQRFAAWRHGFEVGEFDTLEAGAIAILEAEDRVLADRHRRSWF